MGKNGYLERRVKEISTWRKAEKDTCIQFMVDTLMLTLNDPDVMGKDVFGEDRIVKVVESWMKKFDEFHGAIEDTPEADYYQEKLDAGIRRILKKKGIVPHEERYPWLKKQRY